MLGGRGVISKEDSTKANSLFQSEGLSVMKVRWKMLIAKTTFWVLTEVFLTVLGLDNLADYSEFSISQHTIDRDRTIAVCLRA